ncbi:hypothetical protein MA16_Dca016225 [Dendrobium catenatum]|uniref:Uncharacterized protein n=1 Tax=Dendrobium catenatum TaxID=906689 RepID=A0A2I0VVR6_9ASPA|nr:hypothetical protein MA16_Dca016225 [Dendrobium catenatum]
MSSIIFWNCRGARKKQTGHFLRSLIGGNEVVFVGLMETMIDDISRVEVDVLAGANWDFLHFPANGRSGGILALWRRDCSRFVATKMMEQAMVGQLVLPNNQEWTVAIVYTGKNYHSIRVLWEALSSCIDANLPVIMGGAISIVAWINAKNAVGAGSAFPLGHKRCRRSWWITTYMTWGSLVRSSCGRITSRAPTRSGSGWIESL